MKKKLAIIAVVLLSAYLQCGCDDDHDDEWMPSTCQFYIRHYKFPEGHMSYVSCKRWGETLDCDFISKGCKWTIVDCPYWITIAPTSGGSGSERVQIKVNEYYEYETNSPRDYRKGTVKIHIEGVDIDTYKYLDFSQTYN